MNSLNNTGAVKRNTQTASCNRKDVESAVAKWLLGSRDRNGGRVLRAWREKEQREAIAAAQAVAAARDDC